MKPILLLLGVICYCSAFSQKVEINYSTPLQIDSSEYFMIPELIDNDNKEAYGKGKGYLLWGNYTDIYFYNAKTNESKKLFGTTLALVSSFNTGRQYYYDRPGDQEEKAPANILPRHILYLARTADYNGDKALDSDDPVYLYLSDKTGNNLARITPEGMNLVSWTLSKDKQMILVKLQRDKNGNKKFGQGDDDVYYRVDLQEDVSKVKCYPLPLQ
ncbi:MAG: hypothetical protein ABW019_01270 [Chitinophagaceae bacterium]